MLREEAESFTNDEQDMGCIEELQIHMTLTDKEPVQRSYMSIPKLLHRDVMEYLLDFIQWGWTIKSKTPYSSPIVCVRKPDGSLRLCADYWALNAKTVAHWHPIPKIQDVLNTLHGNHGSPNLDQGTAYHRGFMHEDSRQFTAFVTPWGSYEWARIPVGLLNAPAAFQRMATIYGRLSWGGQLRTVHYLSWRCTVFSATFEEQVEQLRKTLRKMCESGMKLRPAKCHLFQHEVEYLVQNHLSWWFPTWSQGWDCYVGLERSSTTECWWAA